MRALGYDDRFERTWDFYLAFCEAAFRTRIAARRPARPGPAVQRALETPLRAARAHAASARSPTGSTGVRDRGRRARSRRAARCILVANHESLIDPWILGARHARPVRYMAKAELWRYRLVARVMDVFGAFPVERGTGDAAAISRAAALLAGRRGARDLPAGDVRSRSANRPCHRGAARLALATGAPIVPVRLVGTRALPAPADRPRRRPHRRRASRSRSRRPTADGGARPGS